ncbi:hypothetical protein X971_3047 [Agrobacterium tumefaciens LBA4213 (Ach5)]|nr:hypothetical protein X971_3047 [Agrobacterium tumefaciens LBA4213 (Ach5)]
MSFPTYAQRLTLTTAVAVIHRNRAASVWHCPHWIQKRGGMFRPLSALPLSIEIPVVSVCGEPVAMHRQV